MKLKYKTIVYLVIIVIIVSAIFTYIIINYIKKNQERVTSCKYLNNDRYNEIIDPIYLIDCFNIFSIETADFFEDGKKINAYIIRDNKNNYGFAIIKDLKQYKIVNDYLYVYETLIARSESYTRVKYNQGDWQYPREYYINGNIQKILYKSPNDFPQYLKVEISSGEIILYNNYSSMPEEIKQIFQELENSI